MNQPEIVPNTQTQSSALKSLLLSMVTMMAMMMMMMTIVMLTMTMTMKSISIFCSSNEITSHTRHVAAGEPGEPLVTPLASPWVSTTTRAYQ